MAVTYSSALMAAAACSFGAQADKEREASEWELLRGSAGPQIEEKGEMASDARALRPRDAARRCSVGHDAALLKAFKNRRYQYYRKRTS